MQALFAFGGSKDKVEKLLEGLPLVAKSFVEENFDLKKKKDADYIIYYYLLKECSRGEISDAWIEFDSVAEKAEELDISWITYDLDTEENHHVESSGYDGDEGRDVSLVEIFYVKSTIEAIFD